MLSPNRDILSHVAMPVVVTMLQACYRQSLSPILLHCQAPDAFHKLETQKIAAHDAFQEAVATFAT